MTIKKRRALSRLLPIRKLERASVLIALAGLLGGAQSIVAATIEDGCMQDIAGYNLNCTANDVQIASADVLEITDPCDFPGDEVTFTAQFDVVVTAKERWDIGLYFAIDGDPNGDGAISEGPFEPGEETNGCSVSTIDLGSPAFVDLDDFPNTGDSCGDITKASNPLQPIITITTECIDTDGDGFLNLPNCTSWRQSGANELCTTPLDAFPGSPSKCRCDPDFQVPVPVPPATITVTKEAAPTTIDEPGGPVTYTVSVKNDSIDPANDVIIETLMDSIYGDLNGQGNCSVPQTLAALATYTCSFTADVSGNAGVIETDVVTASGFDSRTPANPVSDSDDATVTITDVQPNITVIKTADPTTVLEPGGPVTFSVLVTNNSVSSDPVTIDSLTDDVHGDLNGQGDCAVSQTLAGEGGTYSCSFTADVTGNAGYVETDTVTASGADDEGNPVSDSDSATVTVLNVPSMIELIKTANPTSVDELGGNVTYSFTVNNTSTVDTVTINSLTDDTIVPSDLNGQGTCAVPQVLPPGGSYSCTVIAPVTGNAFDMVTNTATAMGVDDDGEPVMDSDSATVDITNVPPAASLTKTATAVLVTYEVQVCNDSDAEALTLDSLSDDIYGDITLVQGDIDATDCTVAQMLQPSGQTGDCYTCSFDAVTTTSPTTDTVTGSVTDDDGSPPTTPSDSATVSFE